MCSSKLIIFVTSILLFVGYVAVNILWPREEAFTEAERGVDIIYVIPGGGSGADGYPEWTKRRTLAAYAAYDKLDKYSQSRTVFLALSAGSLNARNQRDSQGKIIFECHATINHLFALGIPKDRVFGDFMSWDTVTNGLFLRLFVDGAVNGVQSNKPLNVKIFISDFHAHRVKAAFDWVMYLAPTLSTPFTMDIQTVSSEGLFNSSAVAQRRAHEERSVLQLKESARTIKTMPELYRFLFMDGHKGLSSYLKGGYSPAVTIGYGSA